MARKTRLYQPTYKADKKMAFTIEPAKTRGSWGGLNPGTRVHKDKGKFNKSDRNKAKAGLRY